jgi:hypothetical protein
LFGHEIELLPRVLVIDRQEHRWRSGTTMSLPHAPAAPALMHTTPVSTSDAFQDPLPRATLRRLNSHPV